jgi:hypothetical protein
MPSRVQPTISQYSLLQTMSDYFEVEARLQEALEYKRQHPEASFRWLGRQFDVHKDRIHRRWKGTQKSRSARDPNRKRKLDEIEQDEQEEVEE